MTKVIVKKKFFICSLDGLGYALFLERLLIVFSHTHSLQVSLTMALMTLEVVMEAEGWEGDKVNL